MTEAVKPYKRILVAVDFEHVPEKVLARAVRLAQQDGAALKLIHCVPQLEEVYLNAYGLAGVPAATSYSDIHEKAVARSDQRLAELAAGMSGSEVAIAIETLSGNIVEAILQKAEEEAIELIVLGSHGKHGIQLLLGSTASGVLHRAPCDTFILRI